ncbi:hypothetical protein F8388_017103 [Cannabis sativa]|uniref:Uncharacterized protein n=1 Tax=Cannabis sativa TaxID=3483 RepID=A0A7J6GF66_CANSA|nr:hypothetical protein F8388_017103 [Cannabis sativa]
MFSGKFRMLMQSDMSRNVSLDRVQMESVFEPRKVMLHHTLSQQYLQDFDHEAHKGILLSSGNKPISMKHSLRIACFSSKTSKMILQTGIIIFLIKVVFPHPGGAVTKIGSVITSSTLKSFIFNTSRESLNPTVKSGGSGTLQEPFTSICLKFPWLVPPTVLAWISFTKI